MSLLLASFTATSCLGVGLDATWQALQTQTSGLKRCDFETVALDTYIGEVAGVDDIVLPPSLQRYDCRNNRLALLALWCQPQWHFHWRSRSICVADPQARGVARRCCAVAGCW